MKLVLVFSTVTGKVAVHEKGCKHTVGRRHLVVSPLTKTNVKDLRERGYPVKRAPCAVK